MVRPLKTQKGEVICSQCHKIKALYRVQFVWVKDGHSDGALTCSRCAERAKKRLERLRKQIIASHHLTEDDLSPVVIKRVGLISAETVWK